MTPRLTLEDLILPEPRAGLPYADTEDQHAIDILEVNGIALSPAGLQEGLDSGIEVIQSAAARAAGAMGEGSVLETLSALAARPDDTVRAAAAYALVRLGREEEGRAALAECLALPPDAYLSPSQAAGSLARLGDSRGVEVIRRALAHPNDLVRMVACKQLLFFVGQTTEAYELFEQALGDPDDAIAWQAAAQLKELATPEAQALLSAAGR